MVFIVIAALAALIVLIQTVLPLVAVPMAERDATTFALIGPGAATTPTTRPPATASPTGASTTSASASPTAQKMDGLGIRTLPLISDQAWAAFQKDPDAAIQEYGQKAFGDAWRTIWAATPFELSGWDARFDLTEIEDQPVYGLVQSVISAATGPSTDAFLDVIALLELVGANEVLEKGNDYASGGWPTLFIAIADSLATLQASCDTATAYAHAASLVSGTDAPWDAAAQMCPGDPTPTLEAAKSDLAHGWESAQFWNDETGLWQTDWEQVERSAQAIVSEYPDLPAAQLLLGDTYRMLDQAGKSTMLLPIITVGPFTHRYFLEHSIAAFGKAADLTTDPTPLISLADAQLAMLDVAGAQATLDRLDAADQGSDQARSIQAAILARQTDYQAALGMARAVEGSPSQTRLPILAFNGNANPDSAFSSQLLMSLNPGATSLYFGATGGLGGSGVVQDQGYVPVHRLDWFTDPLLSSDHASSLSQYAYLSGNPTAGRDSCGEPWYTDCVILSEPGAPGDPGVDDKFDFSQDLWRYWGNLDKAADVAREWTSLGLPVPEAYDRLGEIRFLQQRWAEAEAAFTQARSHYDNYLWFSRCLDIGASGCDATGPGWTDLRIAASKVQLGDRVGARDLMEAAPSVQEHWSYQTLEMPEADIALVHAYAQLELAQSGYSAKGYEEALSWAARSSETRTEAGDGGAGAAEQLASLSAFALGRYEEALDWAQQALALDPKSPLYQEAVADAMRALGQAVPTASATSTPAVSTGPTAGASTGSASGPTATGSPSTGSGSGPASPTGRPTSTDPNRQAMMDAYWAGLELDQTLFSTWNNLGVLLAEDGQVDQAADCFRQAVTARPDYPLGWFNLGVAQRNQAGLAAFLRSQGALGKAGQLDRALRNQAAEYTFDDQVYDAHLDVSKPIPQDWTLNQTVRTNAAPLTVGLILMVVLRGTWAGASSWLTGAGAGSALRRSTRRLTTNRFFTLKLGAIWTTLATFASLVWLAGASGGREYVAAGATFAALLAIHALAPRFVATETAPPHRSLLPASVLTLALTPLGLGFAPPAPLVEDAEATLAARRSGVIALGLIAALFCTIAWITGVPLIRAAATGCLVLVSSALVPVSPLDGARLGLARRLEWAITLALAGFTVLFALGIV